MNTPTPDPDPGQSVADVAPAALTPLRDRASVLFDELAVLAAEVHAIDRTAAIPVALAGLTLAGFVDGTAGKP